MRGFLRTFVVAIAMSCTLSCDPVHSQAPVPPVAVVAPEIKLPEKITGKVGAYITVSAVTNGTTVRWFTTADELNVFPATMLKDTRSTVVSALEPGEYKLVGYTALGDVPSEPSICIVVVQGKTPPTPVPPTPTPTPPGPTPDPKPDVVPIAEKGLRVLLIYNDDDLLKPENAKYLGVINSTKIAAYCAAACVKVNGQPEVRFVDDNETFAHESKIWQDAIKRPRTSKFWVLVSNGDAGEEGPCPDNEDAFIELCKKYEVK